MPIRLGQQIGGWATQVAQARERIESSSAAPGGAGPRRHRGRHRHQRAPGVRREGRGGACRNGPDCRSSRGGTTSRSQATQDTAVELSGQLKAYAVGLMKIANDLRHMNSGPQAGLAEIVLPALQPGSSIMPGKINPVICEAVMMVCAQVIGNDLTVTIGGADGQLRAQRDAAGDRAQPAAVHRAARLGIECARGQGSGRVHGQPQHIADLVDKNPIMVTALNSIIGYDLGAKIAKRAYAENRRVKDVAAEMTDLSPEDLDKLLDPADLADGGIKGGAGGGG